MAPAAAAAPQSNWLSFSLSPMEMLANSHHHQNSQMLSPPPHLVSQQQHYFLNSLYSTTDWSNQKVSQHQNNQHHHQQNNQGMGMGVYGEYAVDQQPLENNSTVPKLEDFFGGDNHNNNTASYNSQQTESTTQDSSSQLTPLYDSHHHHHHNNHHNYFADHHHHNNHQDLKAAMTESSTWFQTAFSTNSGSEVDDSGSVLGRATASTQLACAEYVGQSIEPEMVQGYTNTNTAATTTTATATTVVAASNNAANGGNLSLAVVPEKSSGVVTVVESDNTTTAVKKVSDTFGQRTSIYRGVTRHRWTGRYEAHLWDNSCRREGQARKGRQVYLGGYDKEDKAARAYDLAALKYWGPTATTNFPVTNYAKELEDMKLVTKQEFIASLRRKSSGFSRGASIYRGVTRHHQQGRWQARIGRVAGNKDLYLGTFATEEEAAEAYDIAAIKFRGVNAVTNFEMNRYDIDAILKSNLPIGGAAKRLKLATEFCEQKPTLSLDQQSHSSNGSSGNSSTINFSAIQPVPQMSCTMPFDNASAYYHQNLLQHLSSNGAGHALALTPDAFGSNTISSMSLMPQTLAEFYIWPHQSY